MVCADRRDADRLRDLRHPAGGKEQPPLLHILRQLVTGPSPRRVVVLDPKGELVPYSDYLMSTVLDDSQVAFDLAPPSGDYARWFRQLLPQLGSIMGLIQGVEILQEAGQIAIEQLERYRHATGHQAELCLQDIGAALPIVPESTAADGPAILRLPKPAWLAS